MAFPPFSYYKAVETHERLHILVVPKKPETPSYNSPENLANRILEEISEYSRYTKFPDFAKFLKLLVAFWSQGHDPDILEALQPPEDES